MKGWQLFLNYVVTRVKVIRNFQIKRILLGVPLEHKHLRALIELKDGTKIVLHEATVAGMVRAFLTTKFDPIRDAVELAGTELADRRAGFAEYQLLETEKAAEDVRKDLSQVLHQK